jgi:serine/threonine-protein kinase HipA
MAKAAGIDMSDCRLHEENGRAHFMTRRFDRTDDGDKLHMQSLGALMHYDFNAAGAYAYEQALQTIRRLRLPKSDMEQQIRRTYFNILARNQDDHVKNIAFLMDRKGQWRLSPAFDVAYSYNPSGDWTSQHQMSLGGKRDKFSVEDLLEFASLGDVKKAKAKRILSEVSQAVANCKVFASQADVPQSDIDRIAKAHRAELFV